MKRLSISPYLPALLILAISACIKVEASQNEDNIESVETIKSITYSIDKYTFGEDTPQTKTILDTDNSILWSAGDTVGIYPNQGAQVYFTLESGGASQASFDGGGWAFKAGSTYSAYYPFIGNIYLDRTNIPVCFTGQKQTGTAGVDHLGSHLYMYTEPSSVSTGVLNFQFKHLPCIIRVTATLPAGTYTKLAITAPSALFVKEGHYNLSAGSCSIVGDEYSTQIQIDLTGVTLTEQTQFKIYLTSAPVDLKGKEITVSVLDSQKKELQCKKTPSYTYTAGKIWGLTCISWTEVPQSMGMIIADWGNGGSIGGDAE